MDTRHDLLDVDHLLTDEERAIRDTARRFAQDKLEPHVAEWAETGELPARDIAKQMGGAGLLGMHLEGYGCAGVGPTAYGLASIELEASTAACGRCSPCRARSRCTRSTPTAPRSRSSSGSPAWPPATTSARSA